MNNFDSEDNKVNHRPTDHFWLDRDLLKASHKIASLIYGAVMVTVPMYIMLCELLARELAPFNGFVNDPALSDMETKLRLVCYGAALVSFFLIFSVNKLVLSFRADTENIDVATRVCIKQLTMAALIKAAYIEVVLVLGLVMFFTYGVKDDLYAFSALAVLYFIYFFPKYRVWEEWVEKVERSYIGFHVSD